MRSVGTPNMQQITQPMGRSLWIGENLAVKIIVLNNETQGMVI